MIRRLRDFVVRATILGALSYALLVLMPLVPTLIP